jgi:hypothetical protein
VSEENTTIETPSTEVESAPESFADLLADTGITPEQAGLKPEDIGESKDEKGYDSIDDLLSNIDKLDTEDNDQQPEPDGDEVIENPEPASEANTEEVTAEIKTLDELLSSGNLDASSIKVKGKVDGKETEVPLDQLIKEGFGQQAVNKRFTELDKAKKEFQGEVDRVNTYVNGFREKYNEGGVLEAFSFIGELAGAPGYEIKEQLIKALEPEIERRYGLTDQELALEYKEAQTNYKEKSLAEKQVKLDAEQTQAELSYRVSEAKQSNNISEEEWDSAIHSLDNRLDPSIKEISVEQVVEEVGAIRAESSAISYLDEIDGNLKENVQTVSELKGIILRNPDFTPEDIRQILNNTYTVPKQREAETKLAKKVTNKGSVRQSNNLSKQISTEEDEYLQQYIADAW